jgi:hypothetical protein
MLTDFHVDEAKKKLKNKKMSFYSYANSQYLFAKIAGIGP